MFKKMEFMSAWAQGQSKFNGKDLVVSRLGYTGEDGFEVAVPNTVINQFIEELLKIKNPENGEALN